MKTPRVILITGASSGVGKCTAQICAQAGHIVYGTSRQGQDPAGSLQWRQGVCLLRMDVNDAQSVQLAVRRILQDQGRLDVLINNAGYGIAGPLCWTEEDEVAEQMQTNFFGAIRVLQAAYPHLMQSNGRVLYTSSLAAQIPIPYQSLYSAGKAGMEITLQALNMESIGRIQCCCVELGDTKTSFTQHRRYVRGAEREDGPQKQSFLKSIQKMEQDEQSGRPPEQAARRFLKLVEKKHLPPLAIVGGTEKAIYLLRKLLPLRWSNAIIRRLYT